MYHNFLLWAIGKPLKDCQLSFQCFPKGKNPDYSHSRVQNITIGGKCIPHIQSEFGKYLKIFRKISLVPQNIIMDLNYVMPSMVYHTKKANSQLAKQIHRS
jgi:hypothetical protein